MTAATDGKLRHLHGAAATLATISANPRGVAWVMLVLMVVIAWAYLVAMTAVIGIAGTFNSLGPGMSGLDYLSAKYGLDAVALPILASSPWLRQLGALCGVSAEYWTPGIAVSQFTVWFAMAIAMMLPTATPMLRTYAEIADTAAQKGRRIVSPLVLAAGYLTIWAGFALLATALQWVLGMIGAISANGLLVSTGLSAAVIAGAGLYQFTSQKHACLIKCANPFPFLFTNWTERTVGVFRLGVREGIHCLACCWALMLAMLAVGTMNILWIAVLTVVMTVEKLIGARWFSQAVGVLMLIWAVALLAGVPMTGS